MSIFITKSFTASPLYGDGATTTFSLDFRGDIESVNAISNGFVLSSVTPLTLLGYTGDDGTVHHYAPISAVLEGTVVTFTFPNPLLAYPANPASVTVNFGF